MSTPKKIFQKSTGWITNKLSLPGLIRRSGMRFIFPFYHVVSDEHLPHIKHLYEYPSVKKFTDDLDFILKHFKPAHPDELINGSIHDGKNKFILSFDDGLKEMYSVVAPILKQKGVPALFFLNTAFIDNRDLFYRYKVSLLIDRLKLGQEGDKGFLLHLGYNDNSVIQVYAERAGVNFKDFLASQQPYLTTAQIKEMSGDGFVFGGHSMQHPMYQSIDIDEQLNQTIGSVKAVQDMLVQPHGYFAFPFTDEEISNEFFVKINASTDPVIHKTFGTAGLKRINGNHIQRIPMEKDNLSAEEILKNEYTYFMMKNLVGK